MSTDDHHTLGRRAALSTLIEHPLLGLERRRTAVAISYLVLLIGLFAASYAGSTVTIDGDALKTLTPRFDAVSTVLVALAAATITIIPFLYAAWNGGPILSFTLPLVPVALDFIATGQYVLDLDAVIALTVGAAATALALFATGVRRTGSIRPWNAAGIDDARLLVVTVLLVIAAVNVGRFVVGAPPRALEWYTPFAPLWVVPVGIIGAYWRATVRTTGTRHADHEQSES